ncbi:MAG: stage V sporulation protein AD [Lachnospiraceae bacterium]|nr:stage V sporulation protein AD [Lachnospiraceae bacterium]
MVSKHIGKQSIEIVSKVYIANAASIVGKKEGQGPLGHYFDEIVEDAMFGKDNWEKAESELQNKALITLFEKSNFKEKDIQYVVAGDLLGQLIGSTFSIRHYDIPFFGVYGACSTMGESLAFASILIDGGFADNVVALTSSHFAGAEKQFRYPLDYGNQRPLAATWTVTGSGAVILTNDKERCNLAKSVFEKEKIEPYNNKRYVSVKYITTGKIVDYGVKDSMNMGACMAPAAADVIYQNYEDFKLMHNINYYDKIITGDLGYVGTDIMLDILKAKGLDISMLHMDCGKEIYYKDIQDVHSGGSGCGCAATTLAGMILTRLITGEYKRVLFVPTGALLSPVSYNEGESVPAIAHAVVLEAE